MDYFIHLLILVGIYLILAQSFNLAFGLGRLLNLAHIASYAIGAYTTALLSTELSYSFWACVPASMALSGFFALLIGAISLKLSEEYFAIGTLAFSSVVTALLINWKSLTRGVLGVPGIPRPEFWGIDFYENSNFLKLTAVLVAIVLVWNFFAFRSRLARNLRAQAENEFATLALAKNTTGIRNDSFILSSIFAGLAGSLFAYYINYIDPSSFNLSEMIFVLSIVVVGKPGSFWGVILSTFFLVLLPEPLRFIEIRPDILGPMRQLLYAVILFAVVYWKRFTLFPVERRV
jgi:branched-chain amino acid transport system permease protein